MDPNVIIDPATNELDTALYTKPTDTRDFLDFFFCPPIKHKKCVPYGQFLRTRCICTCNYDFFSGKECLVSGVLETRLPQNHLGETPPQRFSVSTRWTHWHQRQRDPQKTCLCPYLQSDQPNIMGMIKNTGQFCTEAGHYLGTSLINPCVLSRDLKTWKTH